MYASAQIEIVMSGSVMGHCMCIPRCVTAYVADEMKVCTRACSVCTRAELQQLVKGIIVQLPEGAQSTRLGYLKPPGSL